MQRVPHLRTAVVLLTVFTLLSGCMAYPKLGRTWPKDEPETAAAPSPDAQKPCTVHQNKDGTVGTSC